MKKVEESQLLTEKLRLMSQEKDKLGDINSLLKEQVAMYEKQLKPLKAKTRELTEKISILEATWSLSPESSSRFVYLTLSLPTQTEKEGLTRDVKLWSDRSNELIEQCNKVDVKEFARLQSENGKLKNQIKKSQEEQQAEEQRSSSERGKLENEAVRATEERGRLLAQINTMKADSTKLKIELNSVNGELKTTAGQLTQRTAELERSRKEVTEKGKEMEEKSETLKKNLVEEREKSKKLRIVANKYKSLFLEHQQKEASGAAAGSPAAAPPATAPPANTAESDQRLKRAMDSIRQAKSKIEEET
eukprot:sb/3467260/